MMKKPMLAGLALVALGAGAIYANAGAGGSGAAALAGGHQCLEGGDAFIFVPAGITRIGDDRGYPEERPAYAARINAFKIARTEVSNQEFAAFVAATGHVTTAERRGDFIVFAPPGKGDLPVSPAHWWKIVEGADWRHPEGPASTIAGREHHPVVHVSLHDALAYAAWKQARLPSEEEFEFAARGSASDQANSGAPAPDTANTWQGQFPITNLAEDGAAGTAPVGCYRPNSIGAHDLIGNVWEWTITQYRPGHTPGPKPSSMAPGEAASPPEGVHVIKGGSFLCAPNYCARYRPAARHAQMADETTSHLGFRLAAG